MKALLLIFSLFITSASYAECIIYTNSRGALLNVLKERGWSLKNYDKICQKLKQSNVGLSLFNRTQISPYQTTSSTYISAYPLEYVEAKMMIFHSEMAYSSIASDPERTPKMEKELMYKDAMNAVDNLGEKDDLDKMIDNVNEMRILLKPVNSSKK